ncbi:MAG TPA: 3-deoxy-8-phosphooctulonate synthase [Candidatus Sumerlaeota bacterium]|nr:3-deoxy-8-phosphooctulonate synthase [Candidatus Sumerlaeota bacterium]HPS00208.1 3-deoxy-8-phosphooctulonate synthase [Candidatus Sumerlaeota bacterium]
MSLSPVNPVQIGSVQMGGTLLPALIAGPCVLENLDLTLEIAQRLQEMTSRVGIGLIFKASYDKANRTNARSYRGPGLEKGLEMLTEVRKRTGLPVLTDVHREEDAPVVAEAVDCMQVPAFLCRQTDLLQAIAETGKPVNVKKGQFMAPADMSQVIGKIREAGNDNITLTERGASFGYNNLVVDMRGLLLMRELGCPVVFDATHSVQLPGGAGTSSGGDRRFAAPLARAAVAVGVDALFLETHPDPDRALCDGPNSLALDSIPALLEQIVAISAAHTI